MVYLGSCFVAAIFTLLSAVTLCLKNNTFTRPAPSCEKEIEDMVLSISHLEEILYRFNSHHTVPQEQNTRQTRT